jgi:hypothetical protein
MISIQQERPHKSLFPERVLQCNPSPIVNANGLVINQGILNYRLPKNLIFFKLGSKFNLNFILQTYSDNFCLKKDPTYQKKPIFSQFFL